KRIWVCAEVFAELALRETPRLARAVRTDPIQARSGWVAREENNVLSVGGPDGPAIQAAWNEAQPRRSIPIQILHPDVLPWAAMKGKRQPIPVRREARGPINPRRRLQRLRFPRAVEP